MKNSIKRNGFWVWVALVLWSCSEPDEQQTAQAEKSATEEAKEVRAFTTQRIQLESVPKKLNLTGRVTAIQKVAIAAEVQGKALDLAKDFKEGVRFRKGEVLVKIESNTALFNLKSQKSQFISLLSKSMSDLKMDFPEAFPAWDAYLKNLDENQRFEALPSVTSTQLNYFLAARTIPQQYYQIQALEETQRKYTITSPFEGVVTKALFDEGDLVSPGRQLGELSRTDRYEIVTAVPLSQLKAIQIGQEITMRSTVLGQSWKATVVRIGSVVEQSTQSVKVFLSIRGDALRGNALRGDALRGNALKEGMYLEGKVTIDSLSNVTSIPKNLLNRDNQVYIIEEGRVNYRKVAPVLFENNTVWVAGLQPNDQLITEEITEPIIGLSAATKHN